MRTLATITEHHLTVPIIEYDSGRIEYIADADIDADGANGQHGKQAAYMVRNLGSEDVANGGMGMRGGKVVGIYDWFRDIVICGDDGEPLEFPCGIIASKTAYHFVGVNKMVPEAYVDSETVPYIVVPPVIIQRTAGIVLGSRCRATNVIKGLSCEGVVADVGPRNAIGEVSMAMARAIGVNPNPRCGGEESLIIRYEIWPGVPALVNGVNYPLQRS